MMSLVRSRLAFFGVGALSLVMLTMGLVVWSHFEAQAQQMAQQEGEEQQDDGRLLLQLRERRDSLDQREARLEEFSQRLEKWEEELQEQANALQIPQEPEESCACGEENVAERGERLGGLARSLQSMKPEVAAQMMVELPAPLAVELLGEVNPRNRARIFDRMSAEDAARLGALFIDQ